MSHPFEYQKPTDGQKGEMSFVNAAVVDTYKRLLTVTKPSAERTIAIRKLQEARMWANVAILGLTL